MKKGLKANEWVGHISSLLQGKGGGKDNSAQAVGTNVGACDEAMELSKAYSKLKLSE